ncbi:RNAse PH [Thalassoporum mexicanum PCC 7367]|uniref:ribonuclease PH n=1 Tax=Thalassoporum mexicanum TaxID=3457544 RepID=UPI00029F88A5|nr:ribonuclease PH [Pseudanabaena sp. PCC 7367]AFY69164.1 RNAse PH [Pseudanabaena sp. PCC 7367]
MSIENPNPNLRVDGRSHDQLRPVEFQLGFVETPAGSVLAKFGKTHLLCTVSIEPGVPRFLTDSGQGWLTAEYRLMPGSTSPRHGRELMKLSGRTQEIQRLIGRSLRAAMDLTKIPDYTITVDVDVLQADAGTRTGGITAGYVALKAAIDKLIQQGTIANSPIKQAIAAVSVGIVAGQPYLDLNYPEDSTAEVDLNVVMSGGMQIIELQGTAEAGDFSRTQLNQMLDLAEKGIGQLLPAQVNAFV